MDIDPAKDLILNLVKLRLPNIQSSTALSKLKASQLVKIYYFLSERWDPELCNADATKTKDKFMSVKSAMRSMDCSHLLPTIKQLKAVETDRKARNLITRGLTEMLQKLHAKYDDFYTRPASEWPKAPSRKARPAIIPTSTPTYSGYKLPDKLDPLAVPTSGSDLGAASFKPSTTVIQADKVAMKSQPKQTPLPNQENITTNQTFLLTTPNPSPFPTSAVTQPTIESSHKEESVTPVEAKILSSTLSQLSLEQQTVGTKRTRDETRPPHRKRRSLEGSPSISPRPPRISPQQFKLKPVSNDSFESALEKIRLAYCGQTIELCGLDLLMKSKYFPKIYKLFESVFKRLQDYDVKRVEEGTRLMWQINKPLETPKWLLLREKIQKLYSLIVDAIPPDLDPRLAGLMQISKQKVNICDSEF